MKKLFGGFIALLKKRFVFLRTTISGFDIHKQTNKSSKVDTLSYKTKSANRKTVKKEWILVDANDQVLGRLASKVAVILRGKHKPDFTPHVDCGDNVIIINADKVKLTGKKMSDRQYFRHTGYPGGQVIDTPERLMARKPGAVVENAIRGMLPKNRLGRELFRNLHVYAGAEHPHEAQQPRELKLNDIK
jgi:large subunit ribosomal protein L13